jgi:hypothetical protein
MDVGENIGVMLPNATSVFVGRWQTINRVPAI